MNLNSQSFSTLCSSSFKDFSASSCPHSYPKSMSACSFKIAISVNSFHNILLQYQDLVKLNEIMLMSFCQDKTESVQNSFRICSDKTKVRRSLWF